MENILEIANLTKTFGEFTAVNNISLQVGAGEIFGFLGPNGAGKTTLLHTITGLVKIGTGEIVFQDKNLQKTSSEKIVAS